MKNFLFGLLGIAAGTYVLYKACKFSFELGYEIGKTVPDLDDVIAPSDDISESTEATATENPTEESATKVEQPAQRESTKRRGFFRVFDILNGKMNNAGKVIKPSLIFNLLRNPDKHAIEAFVEGDHLHVNITPKKRE